MKFLRALFVFIISLSTEAQTIKGFIYDSETTVKGAKLLNTSQNILTYSDDKGTFQIEAKLNDTIVVSSYFHHEQSIIVSKTYLNKEIVIELKKITNALDEVEINKIIEKEFNPIVLKKNISIQLANDIKNRPYLYSPKPSSSMDFIAIGNLIGKLFKKKRKDKVTYITAEDLQKKFKESSLFDTTFLTEELHVSKDYAFLFFEYCSAQNLNSNLLSKQNEFLLIDKLLIHSKTFNKLIEDYKKN